MINMCALQDTPLEAYRAWKLQLPPGSKSKKKIEIESFFVVLEDPHNESGMQKMDALMEQFCHMYIPDISLMGYRKMLAVHLIC